MITSEQVQQWFEQNDNILMHDSFLQQPDLCKLMKQWVQNNKKLLAAVTFENTEPLPSEQQIERELWYAFGGDYRNPDSYQTYTDFLNENQEAAKAFLISLKQTEEELTND